MHRLIYLLFLPYFILNLKAQDFTAFPEEGFSQYITSNDFDGDGDVDLISRPMGFQAMKLYQNQGMSDPSFTISDIENTTSFGGDIISADIDNDGDVDIIGGEFGLLTIAYNDGLGNFGIQTTSETGAFRLDTGDMDDDGQLDIIGLNNQSLYIFINDNLSFTSLLIEDDLQSLATFDVMDYDGDGDLDIIGGRTTIFDEHIILYRNNGDATFDKATLVNNGGSLIHSITHSDFNGDNLPDIVYGSDRDLVVLMSTNNGFEKIDIGTGIFERVDVGDMNGDGNIDIVATNDSGILWYESMPDQSFMEREVSSSSADDDFTIADFNGDGALDILGVRIGMTVYLSNIPQNPSSTSELSKAAYKIFPNPTRDFVNLQATEGNNLFYVLRNMQGQQIRSGEAGEIPVQNLTPGVYNLEIIDTESSDRRVEKIVKQ